MGDLVYMVKNSLEIHRKLKKYHQSIRIMKRQFIVRIQDLDSVLPDFGLGCYLVKANTKYTISMRVEIPKTYNLIIDFWSYDDVRVELLNRTISQNKEISQSFHTYPKTKYF